MIRAAQIAREITEQSAMKQYVVREINPGREVQTEDEWVAFLRSYSHRGLHVCGTCAMGPGQAVVDPELRVRGVDGLRVIDASIMPSLPSGNTNAATIMVGERGVAFVLAQ